MTPELTRGGGSCAVCGDPIDRRATHCRRHSKAVEGDPETIAAIVQLAEDYQAQRAKLELVRERLSAALKDAKAAGASYGALEGATGMRVSTLQSLMAKR